MNIGFIFSHEGKLLSTTSVEVDQHDLAERGEILLFGQLRFDTKNNTLQIIEARPSDDHEYINDQWVLSETAKERLQSTEYDYLLQKKRDELHSIETQIQRLERIRDRDDSEQAELDALIDESTKLFREIRAEKEKLNDRNA